MNALGEMIRREAAGSGAVTLARFMELALYHPDGGYYERGGTAIGRTGDYYTSVSVGELFGELLAFQFAEWLGAERQRPRAGAGLPARFQIVEAGAHDGRLAADILDWFRRQRSELLGMLEYWILEPSLRRRRWQEKTLEEFRGRLRWFSGWDEIESVCGIIFSNELLDAFPAHRLVWTARTRRWIEWGVSWSGKGFQWARMPEVHLDARPYLPQVPVELAAVLPDGFTTEICPAAQAWWRQAAGSLHQGKLLTMDYGMFEEQIFAPERAQGALRAYRRQHLMEDVLADPGDQDITAPVNFTQLQLVGEACGLQTEALLSQEQFLTHIAARAWQPQAGSGGWTQAQTRQFQTLTHPGHLGRAFRVLLQAR